MKQNLVNQKKKNRTQTELAILNPILSSSYTVHMEANYIIVLVFSDV